MGKTVLVLSASPRKGGNSDTLCDEFVRGAKEAGHRTEKVFLRDHGINYCTGCGACNRTHECVQKDDMADVLHKMVKADVIVMATPVYFYTMNAQMKTLIDRTAPKYAEIANKDFYFIVTAADTDEGMLERTVEGFRAFAACLTDPHEKGVISAAGVWRTDDVKGRPAMKRAYETGKGI